MSLDTNILCSINIHNMGTCDNKEHPQLNASLMLQYAAEIS